jgi:hypothetical protein
MKTTDIQGFTPKLVMCGAFNALARTHAWRPDAGRHLPDFHYQPDFDSSDVNGYSIFSQPIDRMNQLSLACTSQSSVIEPTSLPETADRT